MGCLIALVALFIPRITMIFIAILTNWFSLAFNTVFWPVVGWFLMPYTTLVVLGARLSAGSVRGGWVLLLIIAILFDLSSEGGGTVSYRRRNFSN